MLLPLQRERLRRHLPAMDGLPVTIRLLDPPLHEFLPDLTELVGQGRARATTTASTSPRTRGCSQPCARLHEENPMLGLRGVRLGIVVPGLYAMQVRAIARRPPRSVAAASTRGRRS